MKSIPNGLVSIGLCADTHYWPSGQNWVTADGALQLQGASDVLLTALVDDLAQAHLDLVLHLGDQTCGGGTYGMPAAEYQRALQQLYYAFATLGIPVHVLPGNHDCTPGAGNWSNFRQLWAVEQGCGMTIDLGPLRLVLLNTHGHSPAQIAAAHEGDPVYGWVDEVELGRLEAALATAGERPVLLFTHQLLYPWSNRAGWQDYFGVENAQAVLGLLERYGNVRAVFQAHAHRFDLQAVALGRSTTTFVVLPSVIEYPVAWVRLDVSVTDLHLRLQQLQLPHLQEASRTSGDGQAWRAGRPEWWDFTLPLL